MKRKKLIKEFEKKKNVKEIATFFFGVGIMALLINFIIINTVVFVIRYGDFFTVFNSLLTSIILSIITIFLSMYTYKKVGKND